MDDDLSYARQERRADQEIIEPPANSPLARVHTVGPPRVLNPLRVEMAVDIHKAVIQEFLHPQAFFGHESRDRLVLLGILQVYRLVRSIEITGDDDGLPLFMQLIA